MDCVKQILRRFLFHSLSFEDIASVKSNITKDNVKYIRIWSLIEILYWLFCIGMSFVKADYRLCRSIYVFALIMALLAFCLSWFLVLVKQYKSLVWLSAVLVTFSLLSAGTFIALRLAPKTIMIFAAALIVPVMFVNDTVWSIVILLVNVVLFFICGQMLEYETYSWVLTNQIIFSSIGIMLGHFVNRARFERYVFAESALELAELRAQYAYYDRLTGLCNRRAYEEKLEQLQDMSGETWAIVVDINGLKEMNDTFGHVAGDRLIVDTAKCFQTVFKDVEDIYRTGGDEFCIILSGNEAHIMDCLSALDANSKSWKHAEIDGISLSYGYARINDYDSLNEALHVADKHMYESKRSYYMLEEHDRRLDVHKRYGK